MVFDALTSVPVREVEQGETESRRAVRYPDTQQLFVGNVPHDVDKTELKEFFERKTTGDQWEAAAPSAGRCWGRHFVG